MDEHRIEDALRAGPPDERPHRAGALARGLAARDSQPAEGSTFRVTLRDQSPRLSTFLIVAVVVFVVLSLVVAVVGTSPRRTPVPSLGTPSATASNASPDEPRSGLGAPVQLVDRWVGPVRTIPIVDKPATRAVVDILGAGLRFDAGPGQPRTLFASSVTQAAPDVLRLTALSPNLGCRPFDEGTYRWALSPGGTTMTLTALADACTARLAALPGTWTHTACREAAQDCLGPLEAGTYRSRSSMGHSPGRPASCRTPWRTAGRTRQTMRSTTRSGRRLTTRTIPGSTATTPSAGCTSGPGRLPPINLRTAPPSRRTASPRRPTRSPITSHTSTGWTSSTAARRSSAVARPASSRSRWIPPTRGLVRGRAGAHSDR